MSAKKSDRTVRRETDLSRQDRGREFGEYLTTLVIEYQYRHHVWIKSPTDLARMLGVTSASANDWVSGRKIPKREKVLGIADVLEASRGEALTAAGYPIVSVGDAHAYRVLRDAIGDMGSLSQVEKDRLYHAVEEAVALAFAGETAAGRWNDLVLEILRGRSVPLQKAQRIAALVDQWHQEQAGARS